MKCNAADKRAKNLLQAIQSFWLNNKEKKREIKRILNLIIKQGQSKFCVQDI